MNQEKIISTTLTYLQQHLDERGMRGHMDQEPCKGDFFRLFSEAYKNNFFDTSSNPSLVGDAFRDILVSRWFNDDRDDEKTKLLEQLFNKWEAWRYAWDNYSA
jgi:hypothetical protein